MQEPTLLDSSSVVCFLTLKLWWFCQLRRSVSDGEVGQDVLEDLISMLAERFPSVVGEEREGEESTHMHTAEQPEDVSGQHISGIN